MNRLSEAIRFSKQVRELKRSPRATKIWRRIYEKLSSGESGTVGSILARGEAQVVRLSNLYALLDQSVIIQAKHMNAALALWDYCETSARFIFGDAVGDSMAERIFNQLRMYPAGLTRTEIMNFLGRHKRSSDIHEALRTLAEQGRARRRLIKTSGRPVEQWSPIEGEKHAISREVLGKVTRVPLTNITRIPLTNITRIMDGKVTWHRIGDKSSSKKNGPREPISLKGAMHVLHGRTLTPAQVEANAYMKEDPLKEGAKDAKNAK
jgi:hypothetical protein